MKRIRKIAAVWAALLLGASLPGAAAAEEGRTEKSFFAMDTFLTFTAYGDGAEAALDKAEKKVLELENKWSVTDENSEIYKANHSGGESIAVSDETAGIIQFALSMAEETDGALDPTIYPVLTAWGFTTDENRIPSQEELDARIAQTGYENVRLDGNELQIPNGMELDLGAVGKGYAGDLAAEILEEEGITSALLNLGGNIQAVGTRPDGSEWRLGLRSPFGEGQIGVLTTAGGAVVTSGNYEKYFIGEGGVRYGHIIDPATGYPVDNGLASVTVITEEGKLGDALSTSLFVMGLEKAEEYWKAHPGFEMIAVTEDGQIYLTEGVQDAFSLDADFANLKQHIITREQ